MANLGAYPLHGGQLRQIAERFGIPLSELLDFSANINPDGPPPSVLSTLRISLDVPSTLTAYPDLQQTDLKRSLARYVGAKEENIIVANGFVPLLEATLRTLRITTCLLPVPAFVEYRKTLGWMGIQIVPHPLDSGRSFEYDPLALITGRQEAVLLANPQNPTGICHDAASLCEIVTRALERSVYVLLDEAFIDYVPEHSLSAMIDRFPNLIVFRSVTKFYGTPGLRVAYAVTDASRSAAISDNLPPWPITTLASLAVIAALEDKVYIGLTRSDNIARRTTLQGGLESSGLMVYGSAANFLLFRVPSAMDSDAFWRQMIVEHRIVLRSCANYESLAGGHFRAAVRIQSVNEKLSAAVAKTLSELQRD